KGRSRRLRRAGRDRHEARRPRRDGLAAPLGSEVPAARAAPRGWRQWGRHHTVALVATAVDYLVMVICVERGELNAVTATPLAALAGAITSFLMNRWYTY